MPSATIKGDNTILWGAGGVYTASGCGFVTSGSKELTGEKIEIKDKDGFTVAVVWFDDKKNLVFEAIISTAAPELERGDAATICGVAYALIDTVTEIWANNDARKYRVTATNYTGITAPP